MKAWLKENSPVDGEDLERHDKWLCMMWPRLHLLRELLSEDGVIFISIDDNEQHHLRMLMDEIFGEGNFLAEFVWKKRTGANDAKDNVSIDHEYVISYTNSETRLSGVKKSFTNYSNPDNDPRGDWTSGDLTCNKTFEERPNLYYPITDPDTGTVYEANPIRVWVYEKERMEQLIAEDKVIFPKEGKGIPKYKRHLSEVRSDRKPFGSIITTQMNFIATRHLREILDGQQFDYPKGVDLLKQLIMQGSHPDDSIILDSFAGSGTTAQAVLALNKEDGGNRKFILVECEDYADTITAERVRRVINGVSESRDKSLQEGLGGSFTYCTLGDPIDAEGMLTGDALPEYTALAAYLLHVSSGVSAGKGELIRQNDDGLFHSNGSTNYYLLYEPDLDYLCGNEAMLNAERAQRISEASRAEGKRAVVFGAGKYITQRDLTPMGITFCQLPHEMRYAGR